MKKYSKRVVGILMFICCGTLLGQNRLEEKLDAFQEVKVYDGIAVTLVRSKENKAIITGLDAGDVSVVNNNGKLKIRMGINKIFKGNQTFVELRYTDILDIIDVNEKAFVSSDEVLKQIDLTVRAQEGGEMDLKVEVSRLNVKSVSGGIIDVKGKAKNQEVEVNTGGVYDGMDLDTEQTVVTVSAGGNASARASEYMQANVRAGGTINVYGNPKVLEKGKFIGGEINEMQ